MSLFRFFRSLSPALQVVALFAAGSLVGGLTAAASTEKPSSAAVSPPAEVEGSVQEGAGVEAGHTEPPEAERAAETSSPDEEAEPSPDRASRRPRRPQAFVERVIDGDTIEVLFRGRSLDIRLIGVDTPETVHPSQPDECYGDAASEFTRKALEGRRVGLQFDVERLDRYGRTLAYVFVNNRLFNRTLVARGFAQVSTYPPNVRYTQRFLSAQRRARAEDRGLWSGCTRDAGSEQAAVSQPGSGCDPSYPDVCIPPAPPDLDCDEVNYSDFRVVGDDPHGFDGDGDGVGCES